MSIPEHTALGIPGRLRHALKKVGVSIARAAELCDIPYRTLQNYLLENRSPASDVLQKICNKFSINGHWLLTGDGNIFIQNPKSVSNSDLNWSLLRKILISIEKSEINSALYVNPSEKATAISIAYSDLNYLAQSHPKEAAKIFGDEKLFDAAVTQFFMRRMLSLMDDENVQDFLGRIAEDNPSQLVFIDNDGNLTNFEEWRERAEWDEKPSR